MKDLFGVEIYGEVIGLCVEKVGLKCIIILPTFAMFYKVPREDVGVLKYESIY